MPGPQKTAGYFPTGLPFNRLGHGPRPLVVLLGLMFENKPFNASMFGMYRFLAEDYTVYVVGRKPGLPAGYTMRDMAGDYAATIRAEFGGPLDLIGTSTGGSIVQHLAADHPGLVRRLVIHSSAYILGPRGKEAQLRLGQLARQRKWRAANAVMIELLAPPNWFGKILVSLGSLLASLAPPGDPSDLVVTVEAEDVHNFKDRLAEIVAPTLVIAGDRDPFFTPALFRETAAGIPGARLILYPGMGHPAAGKQFHQDVLAFLKEGLPVTPSP